MPTNDSLGKIVILNGAPRSGKSSIIIEIQNTFDGVWINLGVDKYKAMIPDKYQPGIGLRPGGEGPQLEALIQTLYIALYESIAAHSRLGVNVAAEFGHHDFYTKPLNILPRCARILKGYPVLFVGVKCPIEEIMRRRSGTSYPSYDADGNIPKPILLWQQAVHTPGIYDMEADTSMQTPREIAKKIGERLSGGLSGGLSGVPFTAMERLAAIDDI